LSNSRWCNCKWWGLHSFGSIKMGSGSSHFGVLQPLRETPSSPSLMDTAPRSIRERLWFFQQWRVQFICLPLKVRSHGFMGCWF
ncbi:hypothetical protein VIGAN_04076900, partial [Vigna angularis var. angularis]